MVRYAEDSANCRSLSEDEIVLKDFFSFIFQLQSSTGKITAGDANG